MLLLLGRLLLILLRLLFRLLLLLLLFLLLWLLLLLLLLLNLTSLHCMTVHKVPRNQARIEKRAGRDPKKMGACRPKHALEMVKQPATGAGSARRHGGEGNGGSEKPTDNRPTHAGGEQPASRLKQDRPERSTRCAMSALQKGNLGGSASSVPKPRVDTVESTRGRGVDDQKDPAICGHRAAKDLDDRGLSALPPVVSKQAIQSSQILYRPMQQSTAKGMYKDP